MSSRADVIRFQDPLTSHLPLQAEVFVVNVRIVDSLRLNNSGEEGQILIARDPSDQVPSGLRTNTLPNIRRRTAKCGRDRAVGAAGTEGSVHHRLRMAGAQEVC